MDQLIFASLSHTHYWYEVGMLKVPAVTQEESHTGFLTPLPSAVLTALIFLARRIQPFLSRVDGEVDFCVLTN